MTFQEFIEAAKQLPLNVEYPYLPSPKSPESKKYKLLEITDELIKVERDGNSTAISIPHIKTLLENMQKDIPLDVEKTLGSGGNTRSIEEAILCLMPSIFYTRINNRKHIVESSKNTHSIGKLTEWGGYPSLEDLGALLNKIYSDAAEEKQQMVSLHVFGMQYGSDIIKNEYRTEDIVKKAGIKDSLAVEITKGVNIYKYFKKHPFTFTDIGNTAITSNINIPIQIATIFSLSSFPIHTPFAQKYIRSLLAKPFVILSGNSGTGKTRIATRFAKYLEKKTDGGLKNHLLIPVGADWTDNTKILGFYNPLKKEYQSTPVLDFILLAKENPAVPFFLILDEMNLSHVERYFSDFLSAMESGEPIPLYKKEEDSVSPIPGEIELSKNLFVTGTVNIDETTYMFSPKVLDRANVIEFKPAMGDVLANLLDESEDDEIAPAEPGVAEGFMQLANEVRSDKISDEVKTLLSEMKPIFESVYAELEKYGFEFAYRTAKEIRLYALASYKTSEGEKTAAAQIADVQLLQKILPKIHGNRKQIGTLLDDLEKLCESYQLENSLAKIRQMKDKLSKMQYVSFI